MTEDGYINSIIRIPGKDFEEAPKAKKPVVIYQHGLMDSCASIIADGQKSLGLRLVNEGFDLWMHNSRGNWYTW